MSSPDAPLDPRAHRFERLVASLRIAAWIVAALALVTLALPADAGKVPGSVLLAALIVAPLARVAWFVQRWARRGDRRFAAVGFAVLVVVAVGAALA